MLPLLFFGNSLLDWVIGISTAVVSYFLLQFLLSLLSKKLQSLAERTTNSIDDLLFNVLKSTKNLFLIYLSIYFGSRTLTLHTKTNSFLNTALVVLCWVQVGFWITSLIRYWFLERKQAETNGKDKTTFNIINLVAKIVVWSVILILALDSIPGVEINALIASLGIGGIVAGLAVQNILEDLFSSLTIALDQPFAIGDFIKVGDFSGTVEKIGLKSTRLRSISGEQLIFSNSDLLNSRLQNFKRMERRRVAITLGVTYSTTPEKLRQIPDLVKDIISTKESITFERVYLSNLGDFSINYDLSYYVETSDFQYHVDMQQQILMEIFEKFSENGIDFAFPTQTIVVEKPNTP